MAAMEDNGMTKVVLEEESGFKIELERGNDFAVTPYQPPIAAPVAQVEPPLPQEKLPLKEEAAAQVESTDGYEITSPMVGTYYASPSPEDDPFVKVGDTVTEETVVGIVEAMKVMNEIKAGKNGIVTEIYVDNSHPVEFGTKLIKLTER